MTPINVYNRQVTLYLNDLYYLSCYSNFKSFTVNLFVFFYKYRRKTQAILYPSPFRQGYKNCMHGYI